MKNTKSVLFCLLALAFPILFLGSCLSDNETPAKENIKTEKGVTGLEYENMPNSLHMVIVVTTPSDMESDNQKLKEINLNTNNPDLRLNKVFIGGRENPVIGIRKFNSLSDAEEHRNVILEKEGFDANNVLPISGDNYRRLLSKKDLPEYRSFYEDKIKKKK